MPIKKEELFAILSQTFAAQDIEVIDLAGDNDHYEVRISSPSFDGMSMLNQHKAVYAALGDKVGGQIHALAVKTSIKR